MEIDPQVINICPTFIISQKFETSKALRLKKQIQELEFLASPRQTKNTRILDLPFMRELKATITGTLENLIQNIDKDSSNAGFKFLESWANYYNRGESAKVHTHPNSQFSGVVFFDDDDKLMFHRPDPWHDPMLPINMIAKNGNDYYRKTHTHQLSTQAGTIIVFPSMLEHSTIPSDGDRVTVSFNTFLTGDFCVQGHTLQETNLA